MTQCGITSETSEEQGSIVFVRAAAHGGEGIGLPSVEFDSVSEDIEAVSASVTIIDAVGEFHEELTFDNGVVAQPKTVVESEDCADAIWLSADVLLNNGDTVNAQTLIQCSDVKADEPIATTDEQGNAVVISVGSIISGGDL